MTRSELVEALKNDSEHLTLSDAETVVNLILDAMRDSLVRGKRIEIRGFGSFSVRSRPARIARNPRTGQNVTIAAKRVTHFKAGKLLRTAIDNKLTKTPARPD